MQNAPADHACGTARTVESDRHCDAHSMLQIFMFHCGRTGRYASLLM